MGTFIVPIFYLTKLRHKEVKGNLLRIARFRARIRIQIADSRALCPRIGTIWRIYCLIDSTVNCNNQAIGTYSVDAGFRNSWNQEFKSHFLFTVFFFFFFPLAMCVACGILVSQPGGELGYPAGEARDPNAGQTGNSLPHSFLCILFPSVCRLWLHG